MKSIKSLIFEDENDMMQNVNDKADEISNTAAKEVASSGEHKEKKGLYIELNEESQAALMSLAKSFVANDPNFKPEYLCDRYVISNEWNAKTALYWKNHKGDSFEFTVSSIAIGEKAMAVGINTGTRTCFRHKFIPLALNKNRGAKIKDCDEMENWDRFGLNLVVKGKLKIKK